MMSPGISRTVMKTTIVIMISVGKARSSRLMMYLVIANCLVGSRSYLEPTHGLVFLPSPQPSPSMERGCVD